jgi:VWFA-related protein
LNRVHAFSRIFAEGAILAIILLACSSSTSAQQSSPARGADNEPARRINLDVVVTDKSGKPVAGLQRSDFTLLDDKYPQPILSFQAFEENNEANDPPQLILAIDEVDASFQGVAEVRLAVDKFLRQGGGRLALPTALLLVSDSYQGRTPVTTEGNVLADALKSNQLGLRIIGRSQGFYGALDRSQIALRALENFAANESSQPGRKLLLWLSSGWPLLAGPGVYLSKKTEDSLFDAIVQVNTELRNGRLTLYSIDAVGLNDLGSARTLLYQSFLKGVPSAGKVQYGNLGLQVIAAQSGGQVVTSSNDVYVSITNCLAEARTFYTLSFESPRADHANEYHTLQVKLDKRGLTARTRTGYYAQP